jgi:tetratricopeptide (TPR) repeat protein
VVGAVSAALVVGLGLALVGFAQARRERDRATAAEHRARADAKRAADQGAIARSVKDFLQNALLAQADPQFQSDPNIKMRTVLDWIAGSPLFSVADAIEDLESLVSKLRQPTNEVSRFLWNQLSSATRTALTVEGELDADARALREMLAQEFDRIMQSGPLYQAERFAGVTLSPKTQDLLRTNPEGDGLLHLNRMLLEDAYPLEIGKNERIHERYDFAHQPLVEAEIRTTLGRIYLNLGDPRAAERQIRRALELRTREQGADHPETLGLITYLGSAYNGEQRYTEKVKLFEAALPRAKRALGVEHETTLALLNNLAYAYLETGQDTDAERVFRETLETTQRQSQPDQRLWFQQMHGLARVHAGRGDYSNAVACCQQALGISRRDRGPEHPLTLTLMDSLADFYMQAQRPADAADLQRTVVRVRQRVLGPKHPDTLTAMDKLALYYMHRGEPAKAAELQEHVLPIRRRMQGTAYAETRTTLANLAGAYEMLGRLDDASKLLEELVNIERELHGPHHARTVELIEVLTALEGARGAWASCAKLCRLHAGSPDRPECRFGHGVVGTVVARLAGDTAASRGFLLDVLGEFGATTNQATARDLALTGLLVPELLPDPDPMLQLAARAETRQPDLREWEQTVQGMVHYRRGEHAEAVRCLAEPARGGPPWLNRLAGCFLAMAQYQLGNSAAARETLALVNRRLEILLRTGRLGKDTWVTRARELLARAEAERLVFGRETSPTVDAVSLAAARKKWETIRDQLAAAEGLAAQQKWTEARDAYLRAVADPGFLWAGAEEENGLLPFEIAAALLMAGDLDAHEQICRQVFATQDDPLDKSQAEIRVKMWLMRPAQRSVELTQRAFEFLRHIPDKSSLAESDDSHWTFLNCGLAAYRQGELQDAIAYLDQAVASADVGCRGAAMLYLAIVRQQSGRPERARQLLQDAEDIVREPLRSFTGSAWRDLCVCQFALGEARQVLAQTDGSVTKPTRIAP